MVKDLDEVDLRFENTGDGGWQVAVENASAGTTVKVPLRWPVLSARLEKMWAEISTARRDLEIGAMPASAALAEIGEAVYQAVVAAEARGGLRTLLDQANRIGSGLRIWVHPGKVPALERVPWEVFFDRRGARFLALSERTPVVRYLENEEPLRRQPPGKPLRILLPAARPPDHRRLDVEGELSAIEGALGGCVKAGDVVLEPIADVTIEDLLRRLDGGPPCDVVHFIGHAGFDATVRDGALVFEDGSGGSRAVGARHLGPLLLDHEALQLLVLNACEGCKTPFDGASPGLAQALMQQRVPAMIAMQTPITDVAAVAFARHFYLAVGMGRTVDVALSHCRKAMFLAGHEVEWAAPVLYLRSVQAPLLPACRGPAAAAAPTPVRRTVFAATALLVILGCLWLWFRPGQLGRPVAATGAVSAPRAAIQAAAVPPPEVPECPPAQELAMRFMRLGPGTFLMGSPHGGAADERPAHYVTLSPFCLGAYEVTRAQWRQVMGEAAGQSSSRGDDLPVEDVSWDDVQVFLQRLNGLAGRPLYRLPTEAEWEFAARAGSSGAYSFGDDPGELYRFGNCKSLEHDDGFDRTAPVGSFLPNRWGLYDLYGNVSEWVADAYGPYGADPVQDPHVLEGPLKVRRGGSWAIVPKNCRSAFRNKSRPDTRKNDVGFRLVRLVD